MRFNLDHAVSAILFMCNVQEYVLDMVSMFMASSFVKDNVIHFQRGVED